MASNNIGRDVTPLIIPLVRENQFNVRRTLNGPTRQGRQGKSDFLNMPFIEVDIASEYHGKNGELASLATLLTITFRVRGTNLELRIREAQIKINFKDCPEESLRKKLSKSVGSWKPSPSKDMDPKVKSLWPEGSFRLSVKKQDMHLTKEWLPKTTTSTGIGQPKPKLECGQARTQSSSAETERSYLMGTAAGNTVVLSLLENDELKFGIDDEVRTAILLEGDNDRRFAAHIRVEAIIVSRGAGARGPWQANGRNEPVVFDPKHMIDNEVNSSASFQQLFSEKSEWAREIQT